MPIKPKRRSFIAKQRNGPTGIDPDATLILASRASRASTRDTKPNNAGFEPSFLSSIWLASQPAAGSAHALRPLPLRGYLCPSTLAIRGKTFMDVLKRLFEQHFHSPAERVLPLQGQLGGSGRVIVRLAGAGKSAIGILYSVREENVAFLEFSRHFRRHGLPVPEIYAEDLSQGAYLEEDLGDTTLFEFLSANRSGDTIAPQVVEAYRKVVAVLPRFQVEAGRDLNYKVCYPRASFDRQSIAWDLNYFKYYFLRLAGIPFNEQALELDFTRLTKFLLGADHDYFLYRDFQCRNIMLRDGQPWFLDYQGGRKGALQYDIASLLYDGKADLPPDLRRQLLDHYLDCLAGFIDLKRDAFMEHYYAFVYVRILQALGAYGFRGFYERKAHFLQSVPYALKNLRWLAEHVKLPIALPALLDALERMSSSRKTAAATPHPPRA